MGNPGRPAAPTSRVWIPFRVPSTHCQLGFGLFLEDRAACGPYSKVQMYGALIMDRRKACFVLEITSPVCFDVFEKQLFKKLFATQRPVGRDTALEEN